MNTVLWICQGLLAGVFFFSGFQKSTQSKDRMIETGQTGVRAYSLPFIRFIALAELAGAAGLIFPGAMRTFPVLTPLAATGIGIIMIGAARARAATRVEERRDQSRPAWPLRFRRGRAAGIGTQRPTLNHGPHCIVRESSGPSLLRCLPYARLGGGSGRRLAGCMASLAGHRSRRPPIGEGLAFDCRNAALLRQAQVGASATRAVHGALASRADQDGRVR